MSAVGSLAALKIETKPRKWVRIEPALGVVGLGGGMLQSLALGAPITHGLAVGGLFGLAFGVFFARRATSAGAGLIWGLASALLMWLVFPAGLRPLFAASVHSMAALSDARDEFPLLVGYLVCLGMPVGLVLGIRGSLRSTAINFEFNWTRAIVAGGLAGLLGGFIFDRWMSAGEFFPLLAGLSELPSRASSIALQFVIAVLMGVIFGLLFQRDVRSYGSCMGWGVGYATLWWFLGPMTVLPLLSRTSVDWSSESGSAMFGALVGHILYGLILGVSYATLDKIWVRLLIPVGPSEPRSAWPRPARPAVAWMGRFRGIRRRYRLQPHHAEDRGADESGGPRHEFHQLAWVVGAPAGQFPDRHDFRIAVPQRVLKPRGRGRMGMAVWPHVVVPGADDNLAADADRGLRLEHRSSFRAVALADGTLNLWRRDRVRIPAARATLYSLVIAGSAHCHARAAAGATRWNTRACTLVSGFGAWGFVADLIGLTVDR